MKCRQYAVEFRGEQIIVTVPEKLAREVEAGETFTITIEAKTATNTGPTAKASDRRG